MTTPLPWVGPMFDADSLCAEIGDADDVWFPDVGGSTVAAKRMCGRCENEGACLEWALANDEQHGVWGGKSPEERRKIAARVGRAGPRPRDIVHGTDAGMKAHQRRGEPVPDHDPCGCRAAARLAANLRRERKAS